jgi:hypothetical protein
MQSSKSTHVGVQTHDALLLWLHERCEIEIFFWLPILRESTDPRVARWFVLKTKNPNLGKLWRALELKMLVPIVYGHLVYFTYGHLVYFRAI